MTTTTGETMTPLAGLLAHLDTVGRLHRGDAARADSIGFGGCPAASNAKAEQFEDWARALRGLMQRDHAADAEPAVPESLEDKVHPDLVVVGTQILGEGIHYCDCGDEALSWDPVEERPVCGGCRVDDP